MCNRCAGGYHFLSLYPALPSFPASCPHLVGASDVHQLAEKAWSPPCNPLIINLEVNSLQCVKPGSSWIQPPVDVDQWSFIVLISTRWGEPVPRDMNTISPIYLLISPQNLLPVFQHCRSTGKPGTQKQEKPVLEFRYFSSWKKEQIFSLYEQVELKSCRSHVYPYLQNSLCTLPQVPFVPLMWVLRWCSVWGQGRKRMDCSEKE